MKKAAIIVVNYNGEKNTIECLESIDKLLLMDFKLLTVVVDNGSTDSLSAIINFQFPISNIQYEFIHNRENLGFAEGNNVGINYAIGWGADYILLLNNDTTVDRNLINELITAASIDEKIGIVVPKIYFAKGFEFHKDKYKEKDLGKVLWFAGGIMDWENVIGHHRGVDEVDNGQCDEVVSTDYATGCCMLIKREVLEKVGTFNKRYFLYYEDSDLSVRVKRAGFKIVYCPKAVLWHKNAGSSGGSGSNLQDYFITRNRLLFGIKYAPLRSKLALTKESLKLLIRGRDWQKKGVVDFYRNKFGRGSYKIKK